MSAGDAESAAVLTPYNGQVRLIRSILKSKGGSLYDKVCMLPSSTTRHARANCSNQTCTLQSMHACMTLSMCSMKGCEWHWTYVYMFN